MRVEMLPAEVTALEGAPAAAVDPTGSLVLVNPRVDVDRLIAYVTPLLPDLDPAIVSAALRAALRAYEVEALEVEYAISSAGHPCEVTQPILKPVLAGSVPGRRSFVESCSLAPGLDDTQPVSKVVDPGITVDDVPPYPPGKIRRQSPAYHWTLMIAALGLFAVAGLLLGNMNDLGPVARPPDATPTVPPTPEPPAATQPVSKVVDQTSQADPRASTSTSATPTVPPTPSPTARAGLPVPSPPGDLTTAPTSSPTPAPTSSSASPDPVTDPGTDPVTVPGGDGTGTGDPTTAPTPAPTTDPSIADTGGGTPAP